MFQQIADSFKDVKAQMAEQHKETRESLATITLKVQNGLTKRISDVEQDIAIFKNERLIADKIKMRREKVAGYFQSTVISVVVVAAAGFFYWALTHYIESQNEKTHQLIQQKG